MKVLIHKLILMLLAVGGCASPPAVAAAQEATSPGWVKVAPKGEKFSVLMPGSPGVQEERKKFEGLRVSGRRYRAKEGGTLYTVWSFKRDAVPSEVKNDVSDYLDLCAELAWDVIVRPELEAFEKSGENRVPGDVYELAYQRELYSPTYPGRNYLLGIGKDRGATQIYLDGERIYFVSALVKPGESSRAEGFMRSFSLGGKLLPEDSSRLGALTGALPALGAWPAAGQASPGTGVGTGQGAAPPGAGGVGPGMGGGVGSGNAGGVAGPGSGSDGKGNALGGIGAGEGGVGPGRGGNTGGAGGRGGGGTSSLPPVDYTKTFTAREVTRKAILTAKPEPLYTESARRFSVTGTVRLRIVLKAGGEVGDIAIVTRLPHGLTRKAVEAARGIKFTAAEKDGRKVSQFVFIEYNFNLY